MTTNWDHSVDLLIAGSGGGGMVLILDCHLEFMGFESPGLHRYENEMPHAIFIKLWHNGKIKLWKTIPWASCI